MSISYCRAQAEKIQEQLRTTEEQLNLHQKYVDKLTKEHIYLQGSLAAVNELIDYYEKNSTEGG